MQWRPPESGNESWRRTWDAIYELQNQHNNVAGQIAKLPSLIPTYQQISLALQLGGLAPLNTTGLTGTQPCLIGTHQQRTQTFAPALYANDLFFETDRSALYVSNGTAWALVEGISYGSLESRWADLNSADANFLYIQSSANNNASTMPYPIYRWSGSAWTQIAGVPRTLYSQTSTVTIANSVAETSIIGTGVGSMTVPANFFQVGTSLSIEALGYHSANGNPNVTLNFKVDGNTVITSGTVATSASTNQLQDAKVYMTCRAAGNNGTLFIQGYYREWDPSGRIAVGMVETSPTTIDTGNSHTFDMTFTWGTASPSDTVSFTNVVMSQEA